MRRLILFNYTGKDASNLKIAARIVRKLHGAQSARRCLLVDCERVAVTREFLGALVQGAGAAHIRFGGLPIELQEYVRSIQKGDAT